MSIANRPALSRAAHALILSAAASLALLLMLVAGGDSIVQAQTPDTPTPETTQGPGDWDGVENLPPIEGKRNPPAYPNMDSNLNRIVEQVQTGQFTAQAAAANAPLSSEESVAVTIYVAEGFAAAIVAFLDSNGASPRNVGTDYVEAYVPVSLLPDTSAQDGVISVRTIVPPQPAQSAVGSEAATAHGATAWHSAGFKGQGVRIGVIDTGFSGFRVLMGSELPSSVEARCYTDIDTFTHNLAECDNADTSSHGTTVTEAAFDIAPEATYYIANPISYGDLAVAVSWMIDHDVNTINYSLREIWSGPGDGTSPYSNSSLRTVDAAVAGGITWVSAAGNSATETWFGNFSDSSGSGFHNFTGNDNCNTFEVDEDNPYIWAFLRWDDVWQGSTEDLDLQLYRVFPFIETTLRIPAILAGGATIQDGEPRDIPFEEVFYEVFSAGTYCLAVGNYSDTSPGWIQLQTWSPHKLEHYTLHHSIGEPADSANLGLVAVGAADILDTSTIEEFSGQGPTPDGRVKPDIVGADNVHSAAYGEPFYGTSQASPHVAGLAALVKQRFSDYTPLQVTNYLKTHAEARGSVPNNTWGYGFANLAASDATTPIPEPTPDLIVDAPSVSSSSPAAGESFTLSVTVRNRGDKESSFTTLRYYRSTDATITTSDTSMGSDQVGSLDPSGSSPESIGLTAPSTPGTYYYGACVDADSDETDATNNCSTAVTVTVGGTPATWGAIRSFSPSYVEPEGQLVVTIEANNYGSFGGVTEVLPPGFDYVTSSLDSSAITFVEFLQHQEVTFILLGVTSFTYTVVAPSTTGTYSFSGVLTNSERGEVPVGGALTIAVTAGDPLIVRYDANNNGTIEKNEVIAAINDYLFGGTDITKADVIRLINLYLFG